MEDSAPTRDRQKRGYYWQLVREVQDELTLALRDVEHLDSVHDQFQDRLRRRGEPEDSSDSDENGGGDEIVGGDDAAATSNRNRRLVSQDWLW